MADLALLRGLADKGKHQSAVEVARLLLTTQGPTMALKEKAELHFRLSVSLYHLKDYSGCVSSGLTAAHLAERALDEGADDHGPKSSVEPAVAGERPHDLLGKILVQLANAQFFVGQPADAASTLERFFQYDNGYGPEVKRLTGVALLNLGVYRRALGQYEEALVCFKQARARLLRDDPVNAEVSRSYATWVQLTLGQMKEAEELLAVGDEYVRLHPDDRLAACRHLLGKARHALLAENPGTAMVRACEAIGLADDHLTECAEGCFLIAEASLKLGRAEQAVLFGTMGKVAADRAERAELSALGLALMMPRLALNQPAVESVFRKITRRVL